jgi:tyrosinase
MARTRQNVLTLSPGNKTIFWYEKAVAAMQAKPIRDPTSWRYQAAIHEYVRAADPLKKPSDKLPSATERNKYWTQCQHNSWFFLPWHRMYLHIFEQIVLAEVVKLGGPSTWALPYWNYSASATAALLPPDFRNAQLTGGGKNHLYVRDREPNANKGLVIAQAADTDIGYCLQRTRFAGGATGGSAGFGGPVTAFNHGGGSIGSTENIPHGTMHGAVGGLTGWMSRFATAALDPIFWLHHCNIDRLWEVWLQRRPGNLSPITANWLTAVPFDFRDALGNAIVMTPSQVLNTANAPLDYRYDDTSDPLATPTTTIAGVAPFGAAGFGGAATAAAAAPAAVPGIAAVAGGGMAELVGATSSPFKLQKGIVEQPIKVTKPTGPAAAAFSAFEARAAARMAGGQPAAPPQAPVRVFLHVEGIKSKDPSIPYDVYLNLPPGADPLKHPELRAGRLSMFGLVEASRSSKKHASNGLHYTLEITDLYHRLAAEPGWSPRDLRVSLVPARDAGPVGAKVGRLSLYFE